MIEIELAYEAGRSFQIARIAGLNGNDSMMAQQNEICTEKLKRLENLGLYDSNTATFNSDSLRRAWESGIKSTSNE